MNLLTEEFWKESFELEEKFGCELLSGALRGIKPPVRMIKEHDCVVLTRDLSRGGLKAGDIGTVVNIQDSVGYEVKFTTLAGETVGLVTLSPDQLRPIARLEIAHVRVLKTA